MSVKISKKRRDLVISKTSGFCFYCGTDLHDNNFSIDHFLPRNQGGTNELDNLVPCCRVCNSSKNKYGIEEFREILGVKNSKFNGVVNRIQIRQLQCLGIDISMPEYNFYFESLPEFKGGENG